MILFIKTCPNVCFLFFGFWFFFLEKRLLVRQALPYGKLYRCFMLVKKIKLKFKTSARFFKTFSRFIMTNNN